MIPKAKDSGRELQKQLTAAPACIADREATPEPVWENSSVELQHISGAIRASRQLLELTLSSSSGFP